MVGQRNHSSRIFAWEDICGALGGLIFDNSLELHGLRVWTGIAQQALRVTSVTSQLMILQKKPDMKSQSWPQDFFNLSWIVEIALQICFQGEPCFLEVSFFCLFMSD